MRTSLDNLIVAGSAQPFLIVLPNGLNKYLGAFYANSPTTGNWDDYITRDVVQYIDSHYRTLADPAHRVIAGHSMGGFGALTLSFRHPDIFGSGYAMIPCCTDLVADAGPSNPAWKIVPTLQSPDEVPAALQKGQFFVAADSARCRPRPDPAGRAKSFLGTTCHGTPQEIVDPHPTARLFASPGAAFAGVGGYFFW